jgi:hypothetical protein
MSESLCARESYIAAHLDLFHYVIEVSPRTAVPWAAHRDEELPALRPRYDRQRRELSVNGVVAKRFSRPAKNQELVLAVCEEDGWPPRIDDPLPGGCSDPIKRLHDTLDALNDLKECASRDRPPYRVHFFSDGSGQGIRWRIVATPKEACSEPARIAS